MDTENLKIKTYSTAIKNLPDYPSDAGYTAAMLKEAFDARSDNEIKEKHNALCDAMKAELATIESALSSLDESTVKDSDINNELSKELNAEQMANPPSTFYAHSLIGRLEEELGTMPNDKGHSAKMVRRANTAFYADAADAAESATKDGDGNRISTTYATKDELETAVGDISTALDELHLYAEALVNGGEK
ncbi:MAG: hypothetical protein IIV97_01075 [Oscillospiraceae bacterium]|nr:hypothetical protein [Oscillospiraceae bacterium]